VPDPFRDELEAAHERIDRLEQENDELRSKKAPDGEEAAPRKKPDRASFAVVFFSILATLLILGWAMSKKSRGPEHPVAIPPPPPTSTHASGSSEVVATESPPLTGERGELAAALRRRTAELREACWEKGAGARPAARLRLHVEVAEDGRVAKATALGDDSDLGRCVEAAAREWRFERPAGATTQAYEIPLRFVRQDSPLPALSGSAPGAPSAAPRPGAPPP